MKCPGQDSRYWKPGAIFDAQCPNCGAAVEFFKDDPSRLCKKCGHRFLNPHMDFGCASYCKYAEQCIGTLSPELAAQKENLLKDRVALEMKRHFKKDFKRIGHATRVARHAERIGKGEGGDLAVILVASYLHGMDGDPLEGPSQAHVPEGENARNRDLARDILTRLGAREALIEDVCEVIGSYQDSDGGKGVNPRVLHDAHLIADLEERFREQSLGEQDLPELLATSLLTGTGRDLAQEILYKRRENNQDPG
jgi:hypothetical protein